MDGERGGVGAEVTRRGFLRAAGAAWIALAGTLGCEPSEQEEPAARADAPSPKPGGTSVRGLPPARADRTWSFRSRPDLGPPVVRVSTRARDTAPGYVFVAPKNGPGEAGPGQDGCLILDNAGQPVWFRPLLDEDRDAMDFKLQSYRGRPMLTWWEGVHGGYGQGEYVIMDGSYKEAARVRAGNGYDGDHHEFLISPQNTALFDIYHKVPRDLSDSGGAPDATVLDGIVQEVDVETGEVLFEWHSMEHVSLDESYTKPYDYFHVNSVDVDLDDNLLVSSRTTSTVYKIDRKSGEVIWRLGGKRSDFEMGPGARFAFQHDARRQTDGTITIFDNRGEGMDEPSRGIVLELDEEAMVATLVREYPHPEGQFAIFQGNVQVLPGGNVFVGWGSAPYLSEFDRGGDLLFGADFPPEGESYRAFRFPWSGHPDTLPALAAAPAPDGGVTLYASWNGATEVESWEVLAGPALDALEPVGSVPRTGFETAIAVRTGEALVGVRALDGSGRALGTSKIADIRG